MDTEVHEERVKEGKEREDALSLSLPLPVYTVRIIVTLARTAAALLT